MTTQHARQPAPLVSALLDVVETLHPCRTAQVLDFARWLQTQPAPDDKLGDNATETEMELEEKAWEQIYLANRDTFRSMARDALNDLDAGDALKLEQVYNDHAPVMVTRRNKCAMVMMSLEDYQALEETAYLLRSPNNAKRLLESILELEKGGGTARGLIE